MDPFLLVSWKALPLMRSALHRLAVPSCADSQRKIPRVLLAVCSGSGRVERGCSHLWSHSWWYRSSASQGQKTCSRMDMLLKRSASGTASGIVEHAAAR